MPKSSPDQAKVKADILSDTDKSTVGNSLAKKVVEKQQAAKEEEKKEVPANSNRTTFLTLNERKQKKLEDAAAAALLAQKAKNKLKAGLQKSSEKSSDRKLDEDRLARLSQPKPVKQPPPKVDSEKEKAEQKVKELLDKVSRGKTVDIQSYLDRDMPAMNEKFKKKISGIIASDKAAEAED